MKTLNQTEPFSENGDIQVGDVALLGAFTVTVKEASWFSNTLNLEGDPWVPRVQMTYSMGHKLVWLKRKKYEESKTHCCLHVFLKQLKCKC